MTTPIAPKPTPMRRRPYVVICTVVLAHAGALWWLQHGLDSRLSAPTAPAELLVEWRPSAVAPIAAPAARSAPATRVPTTAPRHNRPAVTTATPNPVAPPTTLPASANPLPNDTPAASHTAAPGNSASTASASATANAATTAPVAPVAPRIEQPSASADYLNNPRPPYPAMSKRLGEQGKVVLRVFIEADGSASQADIRTSSGYERLDQAALQTVLRWRYVPGKRNGVAEAMWFNVPIHFVLE